MDGWSATIFFQMFYDLFPELAERETRGIIVLDEDRTGLPAGQYLFLEMYCNEKGCDCRKVFFYVVSPQRKDVDAVVSWGWETPAFYAKWLHDDDPQMVAECKGPSLNRCSPQTPLAPAILELTRNVLLRDVSYVQRIKRHYRSFRNKRDGIVTKKRALGKRRGAHRKPVATPDI